MKKGADSNAPAATGVLARTGPADAGVEFRKRPVYPFSIVPGGVVSREELKTAMRADPLVAAHYSAVDVDRLKPVTLRQDLAAYVSFRMHGQVYWTSRKVRLAKGERLLQTGTEGAIGVRERCGNQVSEQPRLPVLTLLETEPSDVMLATPVPSQPAQPGHSDAAAAPLPGAVQQGASAENGVSQVPIGSGGPVGYQSGGGGGGGGGGFVGGGGGGGGASGGGSGGVGQPVSGSAPSTYIAPDVLPDMAVVLPVLPPITTAPLPPPMGWTVTWITPSPTPPPASLPPTTWTLPGAPPVPVYPWVPVTSPPVVTPPVPPGVPEYPPVLPPSVPPSVPPSTLTPLPPGSPPSPPITPPMSAVPEPSTSLMLGFGLGLLMLRGCKGSALR